MSITLKEALATLGITDCGDHPPKLKFIQKRFYQLSLVHHPDKPGGDNATQQKIAEAYKFLGDYRVFQKKTSECLFVQYIQNQ